MHDPEEKKWEAHIDDLVRKFLEVARKHFDSYSDEQRSFAVMATSSALIYAGCTVILAESGGQTPEQVKKVVRANLFGIRELRMCLTELIRGLHVRYALETFGRRRVESWIS
jgi:hypothetical protein